MERAWSVPIAIEDTAPNYCHRHTLLPTLIRPLLVAPIRKLVPMDLRAFEVENAPINYCSHPSYAAVHFLYRNTHNRNYAANQGK